MSIFKKEKPQIKQKRSVQYLDGEIFRERLGGGYRPLDKCPEIVAGCLRIAQLISSMTIYLMANTAQGDKRIVNELSRKIDIEPQKGMTRQTWMTSIVMNLLLYGAGNSVVIPHTVNGNLDDLEVIAPRRVSFSEVVGTADYRINIDGVAHDPSELLHFVYNPSRDYPWMGMGIKTTLSDVADNLAQAAATTKGFMESKWKPSIIVKVDAMTDEFASPEGRKRLLGEYIHTASAGEPWLIPAEQFDVEQVRPLSLADLAISDTVTLDKRTVAAVLGVPAFVLGVGDYKADEWDNFISSTIRPIAQGMEQELTKKLIISPKMYVMFSMAKLYSYDLQKLASVYGTLYDKGIVTGNEVREKIGMQPKEGLDELHVLENYIPLKEIGNQSKLKGE